MKPFTITVDLCLFVPCR